MPIPRGDAAAQPIWGAQALTAIYADDANTRSLDVWGYNGVLWTVEIDNLASITRIDLKLFARRAANEDWCQLRWPTTLIDNGTAITSLDPREWWTIVSAVGSFAFATPTDGARECKVQARAGLNTGLGGNSVTVWATRFFSAGS